MGKYMRKCEGHCEVAVMEVPEVGVRTRARALALSATNSRTAKRRKVDDEEFKLPSSVSHFTSRRRFVITPENSDSQKNGSNDQCLSASSDEIPASCCSSNRSSEEDSVQIDASTYNFDCRQRRETTPSSELRTESGELESTVGPLEANSRRQSKAEKMPSKAEVEQFLSAAEKKIQERFAEKYNYDIVNDVPLEGRFEWVKLKP